MRPKKQNKVPFNVQKEKEVFLDVGPKIFRKNQASMSGRPIVRIPEKFDQLLQKKPTKNVSKLKEFLRSFLSLINNKDVVA